MVYFPVDTYASAGGSVTITGLAVSDIEIYRLSDDTLRASDNGYTLLDTDGIDYKGHTGIHGFKVNTNDNSHASFWADGSVYLVIVDAITVDGETVRFSYLLPLGMSLRPTTAGRTAQTDASGYILLSVGAGTGQIGLTSGAVETDNTSRTASKADVSSLATQAKLLAYVQLMTRGDEAIETDNATELTEINADGGSGGGSFASDMDALEAIRDHGDQAWLTGAGAGATASYTEDTNWTRTTGDNDGGAASDTTTVNGTTFNTGETAAGVYLQVDVVFSITDGETGANLDVWGFYDGGGQHYIQILAKDTASGLYEPIGTMGSETVVDKHSFTLSPGHTDTGADTITIRFLHQGGNGNASHVFSVDKAQVNTITPATPAPSADSIADAVWDEIETGHVGDGKAGKQLWTVLNTLATPAQVNAEVLDVLNVDTFAEPGSVPAATASIVTMVHWLFTLGRNKITQTATTQTLRNDADDGNIGTSTVSDDATTFTRGEFS